MASPNFYSSPTGYDSVVEITGTTNLQTLPPGNGSVVALVGPRLTGFTVFNHNGATRYIQVFDGYGAPTNGEAPVFMVAVNAGTSFTWEPDRGATLQTKTGIVFATSTTPSSYTAGSTDMWLFATYQLG